MKASVFIGASVDGFIARADGGLDWLPAEPEPRTEQQRAESGGGRDRPDAGLPPAPLDSY